MTPTLGNQAYKDMVNVFELSHVEEVSQVSVEGEDLFFEENGMERTVLENTDAGKWKNVSVENIAEALIMREQELWWRIDQQELLNLSWMSNRKRTESPTIKSLIENFNIVCRWVIFSVLSCQEPNERTECVQKMIDLAEKTRELLAFNLFAAIITSLNSISVQRLKKTWESVSSAHMNKWGEHEKLMSPTMNYSMLREAMKKAKKQIGNVIVTMEKGNLPTRRLKQRRDSVFSSEETSEYIFDSQESWEISDSSTTQKRVSCNGETEAVPYTPFLALLLRDLVSIEEASPSVTVSGLVNFKKMSMTRRIVDDIMQVRERKFELKANSSLLRSMFSGPLIEEKGALLASKNLEN